MDKDLRSRRTLAPRTALNNNTLTEHGYCASWNFWKKFLEFPHTGFPKLPGFQALRYGSTRI